MPLNQKTEATTIEMNSVGIEYNDFANKCLKYLFDDAYSEGEHDEGKVYYRHSMMMYETDKEEVEQALYRTHSMILAGSA